MFGMSDDRDWSKILDSTISIHPYLTLNSVSWRLGHEKISTAILPLPLVQEEQLLVNCLGGLPKNSVVRVTDRARNDLKCVEGQ